MISASSADQGLRIAFVACNKNPARFGEDPSFIYRCENLGAGLRALGAEVWLGHIARFPWQRRFDWVVFHRPKASWRFYFLHAWLRSRGIGMSADFDDLVFDPAFACFSPGVLNGQVEFAATIKNFALHRDALAMFSAVTVSTTPLAELVASSFGNASVHVLPNAIHWSWHSKPEFDLLSSDGRPVIGYFPGTRSHDRDFAQIADLLGRVLNRHPEAILSVTGPLAFNVAARSDQILHHEKLSFSRFHERFAGISVNLAPLETTPFTRCKSALKVLEGAFWNIPTICSELPDAERLIGAGASQASNCNEFEDCLEQFLTDPDFLISTRAGLRKKILQKANIYLLADEWLDWVKARHAV